MRKILLLSIIPFVFCSCELFLQTQGLKNYKPNISFSNKKLNKYQYDFEYLVGLCEQTFPNIDSVFNKKDRELLKNEISQRLGKTDTDDLIFSVQCKRYLARFNNQHTRFSLGTNIDSVFPYVMFHTGGKWFLLNTEQYIDSANLGQEVIAINDISTNEVINKLASITTQENDISKSHSVAQRQLYNKPEVMYELEIIEQKDSLKLTLANGNSIFLKRKGFKELNQYKLTTKPTTISRYSNSIYSYSLDTNFAYLQFNACYDKIAMIEGLNSYVKPIIRPIARGYLKSQFRKKKPSPRVLEMYNPQYPVFKEFLDEFFTKIKENQTDKLVIDLRYNRGGDFNICLQLLYYLTNKNELKDYKSIIYTSEIYKAYFKEEYEVFESKYIEQYHQNPPPNSLISNGNQNGVLSPFEEITNPTSPYFIKPERPVFNGKIYVLANQNTGSSAALLTSMIQDNGLGIVIGTSVGNNPTGATTYTPFKLPKTKAKISISSMYLQRPDITKGNIQIPDIWLEPTYLDYINGIDPLIDKVKALK